MIFIKKVFIVAIIGIIIGATIVQGLSSSEYVVRSNPSVDNLNLLHFEIQGFNEESSLSDGVSNDWDINEADCKLTMGTDPQYCIRGSLKFDDQGDYATWLFDDDDDRSNTDEVASGMWNIFVSYRVDGPGTVYVKMTIDGITYKTITFTSERGRLQYPGFDVQEIRLSSKASTMGDEFGHFLVFDDYTYDEHYLTFEVTAYGPTYEPNLFIDEIYFKNIQG